MSILTSKDFHTPFNTLTARKLSAHINRGWSQQAVAATLATDPAVALAPVPQPGTIFDAFFISATAAGAGESMTIDLLVNGASILTAPFVFDNTKPAKTQLLLPLDPTKSALEAGDVVVISRTYVAGAGTMTNTSVFVEPRSL